ncbi:hypothetical protein VC83_08684 [Pseudogymnoascus destructans]|uniref:Uncharacterized protein n=2 Tax=Pseudogymnoascus destructans TaxID=655981 RepID=L8FNV8_PSED2|nr:uncharacterized protein VC83_08684 [Pseudogymnoascus destructans]ELR02665.1 hypothetical protein GMDG_05619 [Pseudogymnoascus destructans 20631-21]OAF54839.1 hypothetical protein VC83_08684 [Pseudogymnoascus destructans]
MYFPYPQFFTSSSSATSSAASSAASSPTSSAPSTPRSHPTSYHATSPYQSSTTSASPISISSPCAYPSWPTRPSLQSSSRHENAPFAHTAASSYLDDDDLSPLDEGEEELLLAQTRPTRSLVDTRAIREALLEEGARKKARKLKVVRRRGSGGSERGKLSTIVEGSYVG